MTDLSKAASGDVVARRLLERRSPKQESGAQATHQARGLQQWCLAFSHFHTSWQAMVPSILGAGVGGGGLVFRPLVFRPLPTNCLWQPAGARQQRGRHIHKEFCPIQTIVDRKGVGGTSSPCEWRIKNGRGLKVKADWLGSRAVGGERRKMLRGFSMPRI